VYARVLPVLSFGRCAAQEERQRSSGGDSCRRRAAAATHCGVKLNAAVEATTATAAAAACGEHGGMGRRGRRSHLAAQTSQLLGKIRRGKDRSPLGSPLPVARRRRVAARASAAFFCGCVVGMEQKLGTGGGRKAPRGRKTLERRPPGASRRTHTLLPLPLPPVPLRAAAPGPRRPLAPAPLGL